MKLPTSDKTSAWGIKPKIKKGYYPGKLLKVERFNDKDGKSIVGKYGKQLIFEFAVYKKDPETDAPIEPMKFCTDEKLKTMADVVIPNFVYYEYKIQKKGEDWVEGEFQTAITPNSAITKILKALGWEFSTDDVDPESFIGNWVELNIDDFKSKEGTDDETIASSIKDISPYEGPAVKKDIKEVKATEKPKNVSRQIKHKVVEEDKPDKEVTKQQEEIIKLEQQIENVKKLNKEGALTDDGCKQAVEQLRAKIEEL